MITQANALRIPLLAKSVQCVVTSPPYYALRDYGVEGQLGLEPVADCLGWATGNPCGKCYICHMVAVFREVWRVLRDDGTLWINVGDSYEANQKGSNKSHPGDKSYTNKGGINLPVINFNQSSFKPKDMMGIPWRLAFALQADGWYLRSDIIWSKPNPMPESVTDRPAKSHEYLFLLAKNKHYFYDGDAIKEPVFQSTINRLSQPNFDNQPGGDKDPKSGNRSGRRTLENLKERYSKEGVWSDRRKGYDRSMAGGAIGLDDRKHLPYPMRNRRTVWDIPTEATPYAHFATYPRALAEPCIRAGTSEKGCCPNCGKAWVRDSVKEFITQPDVSAERVNYHRETEGVPGNQRHGVAKGTSNIKTIGWHPACTCDAGDTVPCIVLDPFAGSATTGVVCQKLSRRFVGLDLSYTYLHDIAKVRLMMTALEEWETGVHLEDDGYHDLPIFEGIEK